MDNHSELLARLYDDRVLAHELLFPNRHPNKTCDFHRMMILDWHDKSKEKVVDLAFRGSAKSTIAEEAILIMAGFREFKNGLILGETHELACERVHAIQKEIETNEQVRATFGDLRGPVWADGELVLSNGVRIKATGRGQALRGVKYEDRRPDAVFCDDIETPESVADKTRRDKTSKWFHLDLLPACDVMALVRVAATPLNDEALAVKLTTSKGWVSKTFPIEYIDREGKRQATWPDRFPLEKIDALRDTMTRAGHLTGFEREYMCLARSDGSRVFQLDYFRTRPTVRTWQAVYAMFDPARTTKTTSAHTGFACWSWVGNKLVVWDAWGRHLMPNEIVNEIFNCAMDQGLPPVWIGVEEDGLNEFLLQPIRAEMVKRGVSIPFRAMRAPKGKIDFIGGLQPFFKAREVEFAKELPQLRDQLLSFPTGNIDIPNALAYALKLKPEQPIYEDFGTQHIIEGLKKVFGEKCFLAVQRRVGGSGLGGVLLQWKNGTLYVLKDWFREGTPALLLPDLVTDARLAAGGPVQVVFNPAEYDRYTNDGLVQSARFIPVESMAGGPTERGQQELKDMLTRTRQGFPVVRVSTEATWSLNGFLGGYAQYFNKQGVLSAEAEPGPYKCALSAIESFVSMAVGGIVADREDLRYEYTADGRRFISARK